MKKYFAMIGSLLMTAIAAVLGDANVIIASAVEPVGTGTNGEGVVERGDATDAPSGDGMATDTGNRAEGVDADYLDKEIDRKITKIRPMSTPIDQISRMADSSSTKQMDFKYFSIGTRPIKTTLKTAIGTAQSAGTTMAIEVENPDMFTVDDTIRVVGVKAITNYKGVAYQAGDKHRPDLILKVTGFDASSGNPVVYAVNGNLKDGQPIYLPAIAKGTALIRLGKACGELDVQTGRFANIPESEEQYCQNFMMQVEESTFNELSAKNVDWNFTDMEEDSVYDMRLGMEGSYLFGDKNKIKHNTKNNMYTWFTGGIYWMPEKDIEVGHIEDGKVVVSDDDLVDIAKDLFVGTGSGTKRKIAVVGSDLLAVLSKIKSEKFRLKENVEVWDLKFKSWDTDFGEILVIHHELFDLNGMADCGLALDPEYLAKKKFISWTRTVLDLKKAGVRNTNAVVLQEASALYLRYPKAHARLKLAATA